METDGAARCGAAAAASCMGGLADAMMHIEETLVESFERQPGKGREANTIREGAREGEEPLLPVPTDADPKASEGEIQ